MAISQYPNSGLGVLSNGCTPREWQNIMLYREVYVEQGMANYLLKNPSTSIWASKIITSEPFKQGEGHTLSKYVFHDAPVPQVPINELFKPFAKASEGTPNLDDSDPAYQAPTDNCTISCHEVSYGMEMKQWTLQRACLNTAWLCALDVQFNFMFMETLDAQAANLARISRGLDAAWNRDKTMEFSTIVPAFPQFKAVLNGPKGILPAIPAGGINPPHFAFLEGIYDGLARQYDAYAIGRTGDQAPIFGAIASREMIFEMRRSDPDLRELDKYGDATFYKEGFSKNYVFHNFALSSDPEAPRFIEDPDRPGSLKRVWPYVPSATTIGTRWDSRAGDEYDLAPYEAMIILFRDQFTNVPFRLNTRPGGMVQFDEMNFDGQVKWVQARDCETDEVSLRGRYKMEWIKGAKPGDHDAGLMFIFKRCSKESLLELLKTCPTSPACPTPCDEPADEATFTCTESDGALVLTATGSNTLTGVPENTTTSSTLYVTFENGETFPADVTAYTDSTPGPESVTVEIEGVTSCDYGGGVASISSTAPCIAVRSNSVGQNGSSNTFVRFSLNTSNPVFDDTTTTSYVATFGNGTTATGALTSVAGGTVNEEGDVEYIIQFTSNLSLVDETTRDGIVCLRPA